MSMLNWLRFLLVGQYHASTFMYYLYLRVIDMYSVPISLEALMVTELWHVVLHQWETIMLNICPCHIPKAEPNSGFPQ